MREQLGHGDDVTDMRNILQRYRLVGEKRCGHGRKRGVFCAADAYRAFEPASALNLESVHRLSSDFVRDYLLRRRALPRFRERESRAWRTLPSAFASDLRAAAALAPVLSINSAAGKLCPD